MYRTREELQKLTISQDISIREAVEAMDSIALGIVLIVDDDLHLLGIITDGDLRRSILMNVDLDNPVSAIMKREALTICEEDITDAEIVRIFTEHVIRHIPVLNEDGAVTDVIAWIDIESDHLKQQRQNVNLDCDVMVMAGGKGTRLDPFTRFLPKPLVPIGEKPVLEIIMDSFRPHGVRRGFISVNHMKNMIRTYLENTDLGVPVEIVEEDKPLGTAGALRFLKGQVDSPFFVVNCDVIIKSDYSSIYKHHMSNNHMLTVVGSLKHHQVPYGVCEVNADGTLDRINEKPRFDFLVNTGMYVLSPEVLDLIPSDERFDMTHLIEVVLDSGATVGVYPISENAWLDTGQWEEYKRTVKLLGF